MAAPSQSKMKVKGGILDAWTVKEKLALACSVQRSGDQNWLSVSRAIKPYGEPHRPSDWFLPRHCATQYSNLLEKVGTPKRKRGDKGESEVPSKQIVRILTCERMAELQNKTIQFQMEYKKLSQELDAIYSGQWDDQIKEKLLEATATKEAEEEEKKEEERKLKEMYATRAAVLSQLKGARRPSASSQSNMSEADDNTQDSLLENMDIPMVDEDSLQSPLPGSTVPPLSSTPTVTTPTGTGEPAPSKSGSGQPLALLSHLLQSSHLSTQNLQKIKMEKEQVMKQEQLQAEEGTSGMTGTEPAGDIPSVEVTPSASVNSLQSDADDVSIASTTVVVKEESQSEAPENLTEEEQSTEVISLKQEIKEEASSQESITSSENSSDQKAPADLDSKTEEGTEDTTDHKAEQVTDAEIESQDDEKSDMEGPSFSFINVDEEVSIKEEPASPASSILSNVSDSRSGRRSRGRGSRGRSNQRVTRKNFAEKDDASSKHSEAEFTDDDFPRETDDVLAHLAPHSSLLTVSAFTESVPNSPASVSISDTEDEKAYKAWKKSIMLVWRAAANHKDANVFLHPVTNDIAPGYHNIVHRPMDMQTIKKNIESGQIRTTAEFQRDMMLMFTNAIMYNSSNHKVYEMAKRMYDDSMEQIEVLVYAQERNALQYVSTQLMVQSSDTKVLRPSRRAEASDKEDDSKKRRSSVEQSMEGGKVKKRKVRGDE